MYLPRIAQVIELGERTAVVSCRDGDRQRVSLQVFTGEPPRVGDRLIVLFGLALRRAEMDETR